MVGSIMLIGYARVSTQDQNLDLQLEALKQAHCEQIFEDKISGSKTERAGLKQAMTVLRQGDTLIVWKLDRLGRTVKHLVNFVNDLSEKGIHFKSLTESIDTNTATGRLLFHLMASFAEMERELARERSLAGLAEAKRKGRVGGRPVKMTASKIASAKKLLAGKVPPKEVARNLGVSVSTLYRCIPADPEQELC